MKKYHIGEGDKYGRLTCISFSHIGKHNRSHFLFKCDCGKEKIILGSGVVSGNTKSCGCLSIEQKKNKKLPNNEGVITQILLQYKRHAKCRALDWSLNREQFSALISKSCYYCGSSPMNKKITKNEKNGIFYTGIDRVNSNLGYNINNTVPCCKICNYAKSAMTLQDFKSWALKIGTMAEQWG